MQFAQHATKQDLISDITFWTGVDLNAYKIEDRTRNCNEKLRLIWTIIRESYAGWMFIDDNTSNITTGVPYADQTLTSGTELYALPSEALTINSVWVVNSGGTRERLHGISHEEYVQMGGDASFTTNAAPRFYILQGDVMRIKPTPNYTQASTGLRIYFDPKVSVFATSDTTKTPGFSENFHRMISIGVSLDYAISKGLAKKNDLQNIWNDYEARLRTYYANRWQDRLPHRIGAGQDLMGDLT